MAKSTTTPSPRSKKRGLQSSSTPRRSAAVSKNNDSSRGSSVGNKTPSPRRSTTKKSPKTMPSSGGNNYKTPQQHGNKSLPTSTTTSTTTGSNNTTFQTPKLSPKKSSSSLPIGDMPPLYKITRNDTREYYKSIDLTPRFDLFDDNTACGGVQSNNGTKSKMWTVRVGDLACIQLASPTNNTVNNNNNNSNNPFKQNIHYQPIQILSIYRNRISSKLSSSGKKLRLDKNVFVEVRCFYRLNDLKGSTTNGGGDDCGGERCYRSYVDGKGSTNDLEEDDEMIMEEVFESDRVEVVDASFLLGRLVLHSDYYHDEDCGDVTTAAVASVSSRKNATAADNSGDVVPTVTMKYNHHMYLHQAKDILHFHPTNNYYTNKTTTPTTTTINTTATTTKMTLLDELMIRGIKSSIVMAENEQVKIETIKYLKLMNKNTNLLLEGSGIGSSIEEAEDDNKDKKEGGMVTLPPPTLTIRRHKDDIMMMPPPSSPLYSPNKQSPSNKKRKGSPNKKSKDDDNDDSTIITKYYTSAQIEFPASPTTHPYETLPISWTVCVGDVVAVNCVNALCPMGVDNIDRSGGGDGADGSYNEWYPYETNWDHAQITAIYRHVDNNEDDEEEGNTTTTSSSSSSTTTLSASQVQYDLRWFPRISEGLSECQHIKPQISQRLHDIANDTSRTCEEILEGNHQEIGYTFLTLLGPILIEDGNNSGSNSGCGRNYGATVSQFVTQNRRTVNSTIFCDKLNRLKPSPQKKRGGSSPSPQKGHGCSVNDGLVERGIESSRLWLSRHSQRKVYRDAVMKRRKKRDEGITAVDDDADDDDISVSALLPSQKSTPGRRNQSRQLFKESPASIASSTKKRRSKRGKASSAVASSGTSDETGTERNAKRRKKSTTLPDDTQDDEIAILRVKCTKQPFHVDVSSQKSFYDEIDIQPPLDSYDDRFSTAFNNDNKKQQLWKVRLGDMVCIEVEQHSQKADLVNFPFVVAWCPAEIVSIYKVHSSKAECLELREKISSGDDEHMKADDDVSNEFDVMVEVRWFYRKFEIPGAKLTTKSKSNDGDDLEEIFETDQVDACPAECLLAPLKLHEVSRPEESSLPSVVSGMPCIHYHCRRYWSIHRKSFVPSGVLSNRIERGRMHSEYKTALSKLHSTSVANGKRSSEGYSWKEAFQSAIQKLSLAEAAADVQVHGMELKCRERERQHIGSFLRKAIRGLEQPLNASQTQDDDSVFGDDEGLMNTKSSIFICGPPGTGKTASVRSIINELQDEQASGNLPEFNFIALNGMEMRSPFDSYVKFWEALSGTRKERLSAGAAAAKLEEYFGDGERNESREDRSKKPITVLMLDEIDYLVTKKQTILYNFFDWPLRATNARLIVIGISNTINLPERLSLKLQSRLGGERCHFKSYTVDETIAILKTRLDGDASQVFDEDAIKFASRKTGNLSGDIRKAFQMCKVAAQNALDDYASGRRRIVGGSHPKVKISDVQRGSRDMYTSIIHKAISCSSSYEALVLIAIGALKKAKVGIVSLDVREMLTKIESIANGSGEERYLSARLSLSDLMGILSRLGDAGILTLTTPKNSNHPWPLIQTTLEPYEINSSYRNSIHSKLAEKHLAEQRLF